jgi:hypothetical protein
VGLEIMIIHLEDQELLVEEEEIIVEQEVVQETVLLQVHHKEIVEDHLEVLEAVAEVGLVNPVTLMVKAKVVMGQLLQLQVFQ